MACKGWYLPGNMWYLILQNYNFYKVLKNMSFGFMIKLQYMCWNVVVNGKIYFEIKKEGWKVLFILVFIVEQQHAVYHL